MKQTTNNQNEEQHILRKTVFRSLFSRKKNNTFSEMPQPQIRSHCFAASVTASLGSTWSPSGRGTSTGVGTLGGKVGEAMVVLLMVLKSGDHHLGCKQSCEFNGMNHQPQLVSQICEPPTVGCVCVSGLGGPMFLWWFSEKGLT